LTWKGLSSTGRSSADTGPITQVIGTLVCNPGENQQRRQHRKGLRHGTVSLNEHGNAGFSGSIGPITTPCNNPLFLVRIAQPAGAFGF